MKEQLSIYLDNIFSSEQDYFLLPEDKWVNTDFPEQNSNLINLQNISIGLYIIKLDQQRILFPDTQAKYFYWHNRILNNTGVHADSQWDIGFMPSHQKVIIHKFTVHRDGKIFDKLPTAHFQINKTEREKEGDKYEGFRTLSIIISDLQVGDEIEFSYSLYGVDPATKNHFCLSFHTEYYEPIGFLRACVLTPDNKPLFFKTDKYGTKPTIQPAKKLKDYNEYVWQLAPQESEPYESNTPTWYLSRSYVEVCDFDSWKSVVETVLPYFLLEECPDQLKSMLRAIEKEYESKEDRLIACLNFVQKKIRYHNLNETHLTYKPSHLNEILKNGFGDCKDKTFLLLSMFQYFGIEAYPALVSVASPYGPKDSLPYQGNFDHIIVYACLDEKEYWFDPTYASQEGNLNNRSIPNQGYALVLRKGQEDLIKIPQDNSYHRNIREVFDFKNGLKGPILLSVETIFYGEAADRIRGTIEGNSIANSTRNFTDFYAKHFRDVTSLNPISYQDDKENNIFYVQEFYQIKNSEQGNLIIKSFKKCGRVRVINVL